MADPFASSFATVSNAFANQDQIGINRLNAQTQQAQFALQQRQQLVTENEKALEQLTNIENTILTQAGKEIQQLAINSGRQEPNEQDIATIARQYLPGIKQIHDQKMSQIMSAEQAGIFPQGTAQLEQNNLMRMIRSLGVSETSLKANEQGMIAGAEAKAKLDADPTKQIQGAAEFVMKQLNANANPQSIKAVLAQMINSTENPDVIEALQAISDRMPNTQAEFQTGITAAEVIAAQPLIDTFVNNGVSRETATMLALGGRGANINIDPDRGTLSDIELRDLRQELRMVRGFRSELETVIPLVNDKTVGILGAIANTPGAFAQQIPVVRSLANAFGGNFGLDANSVEMAQFARGKFERIIFDITGFIKRNVQGKLSNQQLTIIRDAEKLTSLTGRPSNIRKTLGDLLEEAQRVESELEKTISGGKIDLTTSVDKPVSEMTLEELQKLANQ